MEKCDICKSLEYQGDKKRSMLYFSNKEKLCEQCMIKYHNLKWRGSIVDNKEESSLWSSKD